MDTTSLHAKLITICEQITHGEYERAKAVFDLPTNQGADSSALLLAEALSMMLVRIEAREFELERTIAELSATREDLLWHKKRLAQENSRLRAELKRKADPARPIASAPAMQRLMRQAERASMVEATLLLTGETGTGKGLLARHIHRMSPRGDKPLVAINCAAIPSTLLESELFGIEAGVASGVQARMGRFEQAAGGSILLDEIGEMPLESQAKLLHVIETGQVERVGGRKPVSVGARIMAATHRDLARCVAEGTFRADLFYRLNVLHLHLPPLRERREDIPLLARRFLAQLAGRFPLSVSGLSPEAMTLLLRHDWPGNIRELENELERSALQAEGSSILPADLSPTVNRTGEGLLPIPTSLSAGVAVGGRAVSTLTLEEMEAAHLGEILREAGGNKSLAARTLGISREGLRVKLQKIAASPRLQALFQ